jgi:hypothetical protein
MDRRTGFLTFIATVLASAALSTSAQGLAPDCAAIRDANPGAGDGDYVIAPGGKAFGVYCHDMAGVPKEYLTLASTSPGANRSTYGGIAQDVTTRFTRVRIDPVTLLVNVIDYTFSTSDGADCCIGPTVIRSMPLGHASACRGDFWDAGSANVDLSGTPFVIDDVFTLRGWNPFGSANGAYAWWDFAGFAVQGPVVNLTGGGYCGGIGPNIHGGSFNSFPADFGFDLQLAYTGAVLALDKDSCKSGGWRQYGVFRNQGDCVSYFTTGGNNPPAN